MTEQTILLPEGWHTVQAVQVPPVVLSPPVLLAPPVPLAPPVVAAESVPTAPAAPPVLELVSPASRLLASAMATSDRDENASPAHEAKLNARSNVIFVMVYPLSFRGQI